MGVKVELINVNKSFGDKVVLDNLNLTIEPNESFVILGGSGTGKSVLLKILASLEKADSGQVLLDGIDICNPSSSFSLVKQKEEEMEQNIGFLFQDLGLFDSMTLWENVAFHHLHKLHMAPERAREIAAEMLSLVGIGEQSIDLTPSAISGGMQKRVGIARVLMKRPGLILFDEPTSGLDPVMSRSINELTLQCAKALNATAVTITHDMEAAKTVGDRIGLLYKGNIIWLGTREEFINTTDESVLQFINGLEQGPLNLANT